MPAFPSPVLAYWTHDLNPFLIQFTENFGIRYYGLAYLAGFVGSFWLLLRYHRAGRSPLNTDAVFELMTYLVLGVMVGGRLGNFLLYHPDQLFNPPWAFFMVWKGGMASHGGFAGVIFAMWLFARHQKLSFLQIADLVVTTVPLGLLLGRIANFINGELWGKPATVPWAVIFPASGDHPVPRHPSQLYEAALEGAVLLAFMQWRFWRSDAARRPGRLSGEFLLGYAIARMICELFREPDADVSLILGLSRGTFYSVFLVLAGVALIVRDSRRADA
ncbi:MAG TPA: prolipoprotein diacylglyceryl transferase [Opitutaceae bacterium]|nr:prolipoprotein diacylglyceryl transferase [Opitutaceae bacterium]